MMERELNEVLKIAREAAAIVLKVYGEPFVVEMKGPDDPVTRADREANDHICRRLSAAFPGDAIIAEESAPESEEAAAALVRKPRVFYVDPLDGTREFADKNGEFAVMIGLAVEGRAALGVVVMPTTGEVLAGIIGEGAAAATVAFIEDASGSRRPLRVSSVSDPSQATLMVSRSHRPPLIEPLAARLGITRMIACGSVGVKVARVVTAQADLYVHDGGGPKRWDSCAPEAILRAAGGRFTDLDGALIDYASADLPLRRGIIASNALFHDAVLAAVGAIQL
jgi:3'(2'), 5'-bisphosphate nucleotidase